jgi:predicted transcriptional regulator
LSDIERLLKVTEERYPGPRSSYTQAHLLLAFLTIGETPNIGRQVLARSVGLGEGAIRTLLRKLKSEGLVKVSRRGSSLTDSGIRTYQRVKNSLPNLVFLGSTGLTVGRKQIAILVRGAAKNVKHGIEQRDAAVRGGAAGATTYVIKGTKFQIPGGSKDCENDFPTNAWRLLRDELGPRDGDAIIICGSDDELSSKIGALSAALTLLVQRPVVRD